jgi:thioredoxin reductase/NAD-dependent dihydropyrimidine dehydrogenase PreA subunit
MGMTNEELLIYGISALVCAALVYFYIRKEKQKSNKVSEKVEIAKAEGRFEPVSLHPYIDLGSCIGSGACIKSCPEKDILGIVNGKATVINATSCIGHGACFQACPTEAISLRIGTEVRGVDLPHIKPTYETNVPGIYIAGELGGMGLIKNSTEQGIQAVDNLYKNKKPSVEGILDLVIVGAGPAGIAAGLNAKKHGLSFQILEQDSLGGTVFSFPREKVVMTRPVELPLYGKLNLFDTSKQELLAIWVDVLTKNNIEIAENTKVESISRNDDGTFNISCRTGKEYTAQQVLLTIGRRGSPRKLGVPGENLPKVYYRLLEPEHISGKDILVVGGGDSAIESAMLLMKTNRVTLSYRSDKFARIKPKNKELIDDAMAKQKLDVVFNSNVLNIAETSVTLATEEAPQGKTLPNHLVYIFAGGELPIQFLKNAGIAVEKKFGKIVKKHG